MYKIEGWRIAEWEDMERGGNQRDKWGEIGKDG